MKKNNYKYILLFFSLSFVPLLAKATPMVTIIVQNPLDINNQFTVVAGDAVKVELNISGTDPDKLLNIRDEIQLVTLDNSIVIAKLVGRITTGSFNLTVPRDTVDTQLFVRYRTVSGEVYTRVSHPHDFDSIPLLIVEAVSLSEITTRVTGLEIAVEEETSTRQTADSILQNNIDTEATNRATAITAESNARQTADSILQSNIDAEATNRVTAITAESNARQATNTTLQNEIAVESSARQVTDTTLQNEIASEIINRNTAVNTESNTRLTADAALQSNIDSALQLTATIGTALVTETSARQNADTTLQNNIAAETSDRINAINIIELTPGPRGPQGYKGSPGQRGYTGYNGQRGYTGPRGYNGSKGEKGETGTIGDRVRVSLDCPLNFGVTTCIVDCPDGQSALGGGFRLDSIYYPSAGNFNHVWANRPWLNGWIVQAFIDSKTEGEIDEIRVYAICVAGSYTSIYK